MRRAPLLFAFLTIVGLSAGCDFAMPPPPSFDRRQESTWLTQLDEIARQSQRAELYNVVNEAAMTRR